MDGVPSYVAVSALAVSGGDIYAGGSFTNAGGSAANYIAKWDGNNWATLGSGMNSTVQALAILGGDLYAGGNFTTVGGKISGHIARAYLRPLPTLSIARSANNTTVSWPTADTANFALEESSTLGTAPDWKPSSGSITDDGTNKAVIVPATNNSQFFRLRRP